MFSKFQFPFKLDWIIFPQLLKSNEIPFDFKTEKENSQHDHTHVNLKGIENVFL